MIRTYIALGSNLAQPLTQLRQAVMALAKLPDSQLIASSLAYRSKAVGPGEQPDYLNAVVRIDTTLTPIALLDALQAIENQQGRLRTERWGARTLDLDMLLYGEQTIDEQRLQVPHPRMTERDFVLQPLADIAPPKMMLPDGRELDTLLGRCPRGELVRTELTIAPDNAGPDSETRPSRST
ncbi:2-amino-4-hydroxy-6-hydroxymethyldihydropteridine diphosphokinase [Halioglobus japonicus]|uniref:2-amino-4-hydroxy-6-hydroxymethyldihydropteridine pyrophosphokinase n=1 Tax=Halioglobus japonicus TaxID=930805 RepID=A0AAP8MDF2_9GAMM|nr:2-amino-4-hydroxy-6-hydroxymethyldihydropteridine diphosphokinase [Halioglobus japonicus]AQA17821.1 2-amino-4-hydroxy-6-hydroxymethyldihydropteridine diphosphokinase [Halioglobus japonicus]PLW85781.1 2-amino-4-hydroxy-6-hydroxymethyldihydropteridine diphosphokinase [Halioglobus japonicus]GHD17471.1 2-amino-4-hydroxy-6-hydroxymethyldihydropteridine diphosphokinase [Halioglobus japonicus]